MNYLQLVNATLSKLREPAVVNVVDTDYSTLIGTLVNETKTEVEDTWNFDWLRTTFTITTDGTNFEWVLTGTNQRTRVRYVFNDTDDYKLKGPYPSEKITRMLLANNAPISLPNFWATNGQVDATGEQVIDFAPKPVTGKVLRVYLALPQADLAANTDNCKTPPALIILGAYAKALMEREEDSPAQKKADLAYKSALDTAVANDMEKYPEESTWYPE